jgi:tetratricopeptide (TPR) repeat protein
MATKNEPPKPTTGLKKPGAPAATTATKPTPASAKPAARPAPAAVTPSSNRRAVIKTPTSTIDRSKGAGRKLTDDEIKKAAAQGKKIVGYSPTELEVFLAGNRTLAEIEGITKDEQYRMAEVGYRFLTEGKLEKGKQVFFGLVALDPYDAYFLTCLASAHQQLKDTREAERLYSRALEINPFQTTARAHRGEIRAMDGRLKEAIDDLTQAIKDDPEGKDPAVKRAAVLLRAIQVQLQ